MTELEESERLLVQRKIQQVNPLITELRNQIDTIQRDEAVTRLRQLAEYFEGMADDLEKNTKNE